MRVLLAAVFALSLLAASPLVPVASGVARAAALPKDAWPDTRAGNHLAGQLLRSGTSPYGNHGEAQAPESAEDFIHKLPQQPRT